MWKHFSIYQLVLLCTLLSHQIYPQVSFQFSGDYNYLLNRPPNDALILTPDQQKGITLTSATSPFNGGYLNSFDVKTGNQLDSKYVGFGALDFDLVRLSDGIRVVALTSRGGPRTIQIYDLDGAGRLTFRSETQLTPSGTDDGSNLVLSSRARAGFVRVVNAQNLPEIVSFSLDTGAILQHFGFTFVNVLNFVENSGRSFIVAGLNQSLQFIDASNPSQLVLLGTVTLPSTGRSGNGGIIAVFSSDGNLAFAGGDFARLTAINVRTRQIIGSLDSNYWSSNLKLVEVKGTRLLGLRGGNEDLGFFRGILILNATDPSALSIINQIDLGNSDFFSRRDFAFSQDATKLVLMRDNGIATYRLPQLTKLLDISLPTSFGFNVLTALQPERIFGAWGSNNNFSSVVYSIPNRVNKTINFDLDGKTDLAIFRPSDSTWRWTRSLDGGSVNTGPFGNADDIIVPGDYDGDDKTDVGVFHPTPGQWQILQSSSGSIRTVNFGIGSDIPCPGDYDGDGKTDLAIFRTLFVNHWLVLQSSDNTLKSVRAGFGKLKPIIGDYDGDGKTDYVTFSRGVWQIKKSTGDFLEVNFGGIGDVPVSGDFDNDGKTDVAVYNTNTQIWKIQQSYAGFRQAQFGQASDIAVPADYDGDGKTDLAVYRPSSSTWLILQSSNGGTVNVQYGNVGDQPLAVQR
jgi:hypothetical protein